MISVYFDLETGGLSPDHPIIQIAALAVEEDTWEVVAEFQEKLQFDEAMADPEALKINHYDAAVWAASAISPRDAAVKFSNLLQQFRSLSLISKRTGRPYSVARLVGHNAATFDGPRLRSLFDSFPMFLPADPRVRCTLQRALWWVEERGAKHPADYKLATLCRYFGIHVADDQAHDALVDVGLTVQLAKAMKHIPAEERMR